MVHMEIRKQHGKIENDSYPTTLFDLFILSEQPFFTLVTVTSI